jgi:hypothetical protein
VLFVFEPDSGRVGAELDGTLRYFGVLMCMSLPVRLAIGRCRKERDVFVGSYQDAMRRAQWLANFNSKAYAVFTDTSGNWRVESYVEGSEAHRNAHVVFPDSGNRRDRP